MNLSSKQLADLLSRNPHVKIDSENPRVSHTRQEKRQVPDQRKANYRPKEAGDNRANGQRFTFSVAFMVSDNRRRDIDNMLSTVQDSLIDASGRLLAEYPACECDGKDGGEGK